MTNKNLPLYIEKINRTNYEYIDGYPSNLNILASYINEKKIELLNYPEVIYTSSEILHDYQRKGISKAFKCPIIDFYGSSELAGILTQCQNGNYHINYDYGITELVYEEDIQLHKLIFTSFLNTAMPILRYEIGDFVEVNNKECECGKHGPSISKIIGRSDELITLPDGSKVGRVAGLYSNIKGIQEAQIQITNNNLRVVCVISNDSSKMAIKKMIISNLEERLGSKFKYEVVFSEAIPKLKNGKIKPVVYN